MRLLWQRASMNLPFCDPCLHSALELAVARRFGRLCISETLRLAMSSLPLHTTTLPSPLLESQLTHTHTLLHTHTHTHKDEKKLRVSLIYHAQQRRARRTRAHRHTHTRTCTDTQTHPHPYTHIPSWNSVLFSLPLFLCLFLSTPVPPSLILSGRSCLLCSSALND